MSANGLLTSERHASGRSFRDVYGWGAAKDEGVPMKLHKQLLKVDPTYQREANQARVRHIAKHFNWPAFGVILVAARHGVYYVYDGQHRVMAAMKRDDVQDLPCLVFDFDDLSEEAQAFIDTNTARGPMRALQRFKSRLVAHDADAMSIEAALQRHGWRLTVGGGKGTISCIQAVESVYKRGGDHCNRVLGVVKAVCGDEPPNGKLVRALSYLDMHMDRKHRDTIERRDVVDKLVALGQAALMRSARGMADALGRTGGERVHAAGIVNAINSGKRSKRIANVIGD